MQFIKEHLSQITHRKIHLCCVIDGESTVFPIELLASDTIGALKKAIKEERRPLLDKIPADKLTLWHVSVPLSPEGYITINWLTDLFQSDEHKNKNPERLKNPARQISKVFSTTPPKNTLHIIIQRPLAVQDLKELFGNKILDNVNQTPPKRLFHVPTMTTVLYSDLAVDIKEKGYAAISHVWGEQKKYSTKELGIKGGIDWEIPLSNINKMGRMIDAMKRFDMEYVWFDVLCMPQGEDRQWEVNLEVPLMGDYYNGADRTLVLSDIEYDISGEFTKWYNMMEDKVTKNRELTSKEIDWIISHKGGNGIFEGSRDAWFKRLWTLQEAVLSKIVILVDSKGAYIDLSDVIVKVSHMSSNWANHSTMLFGKSLEDIEGLRSAIDQYRNGKFKIISAGNQRSCFKSQDRFYGTLGILGYKDFTVDYDISVEELNEKMIRYAFSKGDVSWIAIGGDKGDGFLQPMHLEYTNIGNGWEEEEPGSCGVVFEDKALYLNTYKFATVAKCEKFIGHGDDSKAILAWAVQTFTDWGLEIKDITQAMEAFSYMPKGTYESARLLFDITIGFSALVNHTADISDVCESVGFTTHQLKQKTIAAITINETGKSVPLVITGNAGVGDEIMLLRLYDDKDRCLGIVCNSGEREGIFACKRMDIPKDQYVPHMFLL
ncbi:hypothetical protein BGZ76_011904 [Entomortierella beljakovae]|nr:hypothetical protein BGZ76_011904 [Entomortierella beljakovae]